jgi:TolA-binding protein
MKLLLPFVLALFAAGCLKTAEQVRREQRVESMSQQLSDSQNIVADLTVMLKNLQTQIDALNGKVEELQHSQKSNTDMQQLKDELAALRIQTQALAEGQKNQSEEMQQQRIFIEKVTDSLGKMGNHRSSVEDLGKKKPKDAVAEAHALIGKKKYSDARRILEGLSEDSSVSPADKNKALHGLGVLEFEQKNYDKGLVFFSRIYTKYPQSSLAPSSLLYIGRSFGRMGKKDEAKQAFEELQSNYPKSPLAKRARSEAQKL